MPIDREKALGADLGESTGCYGPDDVILYHLGIGAGFRATDPAELEYTFEKNLKVLPSFAVAAGSGMTARARGAGAGAGGLANVPGLSYNRAMLLHGEQEVEIHRPLPTTAELTTRGRVAEIYDKGKAALVVVEYASSDGARAAVHQPDVAVPARRGRLRRSFRTRRPGTSAPSARPTGRWTRPRCRSRRCSTA